MIGSSYQRIQQRPTLSGSSSVLNSPPVPRSTPTSVTPILGGQRVELIPDRFYLAFLPRQPTQADLGTLGGQACSFYSFDAEYIYEPFDHDFGPYHLGYTVAYCRSLRRRLADPALNDTHIYHWTLSTPANRANAAVLAAAYLVLCHGVSPEDAARPFSGLLPPLPPFRDALPGPSTFDLNLVDVLRGLLRAQMSKIFAIDTFDLDSYLFYSRVDHGDMTWIVPRTPERGAAAGSAGGAPVRGLGAILAFSGPVYPPTPDAPFTPGDYVPYFKKHNIGLVIRLNEVAYPASHFEQSGIRHLHLFFPDGSVPKRPTIIRFLQAMEQALRGGYGVAVHCRAGLGRTGSLICAWMMYKHGFTAIEALGYIRVARPGSVLGVQQRWLGTIEKDLHAMAASKQIERDLDASVCAPTSSAVATSAPFSPVTQLAQSVGSLKPATAKRAPPTLEQAGKHGLRG